MYEIVLYVDFPSGRCKSILLVLPPGGVFMIQIMLVGILSRLVSDRGLKTKIYSKTDLPITPMCVLLIRMSCYVTFYTMLLLILLHLKDIDCIVNHILSRAGTVSACYIVGKYVIFIFILHLQYLQNIYFKLHNRQNAI